MLKEFKEFAFKGNLIDMAVAFVMGGAFGKVVTAFVEKMFAPIVGKLLGGIDLKDYRFIITPAEMGADGKIVKPEAAIEWGTFVTALIDFTIVAFAMFLLVKAINSMKKAAPAAPPAAPPAQEVLLGEIRDLLKSR